MGQNFPCGTCRNFEGEHRLCQVTALPKVAIFFGIYSFILIVVCFFNNSSNAGGARLTLSILQYLINHLIGVL